MKANYHTHTWRCQHADGEDREYVETAIAAGYDVLGFSDHCPWVYPDDYVSHIRMRASEVDGYFASLEQLRREYQDDIQILIGFEAEYIESLIEAQDKFLADYPVDYMILGQHFIGEECNRNYAGNPTDDVNMLCGYVDLCILGMKSGRYRYLAHPDLIHFIGSREIYKGEMRRLCVAMKELGVPIEMNILGVAIHRNYPNPYFWEIAREVGNQVIFGMDAHNPVNLVDEASVEKAKEFCRGMDIHDSQSTFADFIH